MKIVNLMMTGLILIFSACSQGKTEERAVNIKTVKVDTVRVYGEKNISTFPGKVVAAADVNLAFRISGPIAKIHIDVGSFVRKGQLLAEMDTRDYIIQLSATEAEYNSVRAEVERIIALYNLGSATSNDYDKAVFGLQQITAKYEAHKNALADTRLVAPFDGYVQRRNFKVGETIGAGMPVISMISADLPEVEINIPSSDFMRRQRFEKFWCVFYEKKLPLELIGIAQKANMNQLYTVKLRMKKPEQQMPTPGMTVMVTIQHKTDETEFLYIPFSAIFEKNGITTVWVYNSSKQTVEARAVIVSEILRNGKALVSEGLYEGEIVITAGVNVLSQDEKVKPLPAVSTTNIGGMI